MWRQRATWWLLVGMLAVSGCSSPGASQTAAPGSTAPPSQRTATPALPTVSPATAAPSGHATPAPSVTLPSARTILFDTDVAADDVVALSFLVQSPNVTLAGITVSGTGEAHCAGGVDVVLRLLERLDAPDIPVACGRETPIDGDHAFPDAWRQHVDGGSGLDLPATGREPAPSTAVELIVALSKQHDDLGVLSTGPLTNLADALHADPSLAERLGQVTVMGGALHVPGNLVCCGAPEGNAVAEWNIYVDPAAAQQVVDADLDRTFVTLDGTNQVPVTFEFVRRAIDAASGPGGMVLADLFRANPFMTEGYYLWDPLAAEVAAGFEVGTFSEARIHVETREGTASGYTKPIEGEPNIRFLGDADTAAAHDVLLAILNLD